ncbi:MAG: PEP-CTERM sorting domain-containing protein [Planctomycetota bacterium]|jgi:hypothetical protein
MEKRWLAVLLIVVGSLSAPNIASAVLVEDFEDGDYTENPTWIVTSDMGQDVIEADPIRADNLALKIRGIEWAGRSITASLSEGIPAEDYDASFEMLATAWWHFSAYVEFGSGVGFGLSYNAVNNTNNVMLKIGDGSLVWAKSVSRTNVSINEWWTIHSWYDSDTNLLMVEWRTVEDDVLIAESSMSPRRALGGTVDTVSLRVGYEDWQYVDNISVTPEPGTLLLLGVGGLFVRAPYRGRR